MLYARHLIDLVAAVSTVVGYLGNWSFGFAATRIRGLPAYSNVANWRAFGDGGRHDNDVEQFVTVATWAELSQAPAVVVGRLVGRFLRAYDVGDRYATALGQRTEAPDSG